VTRKPDLELAVRRFAEALDADNYADAAPLLRRDATYDTGTSVVEGSASILDLFRQTSETGRARLHKLSFHHEIDVDNPYDILFIDVLRIGDDELTIKHTMHVRFADDGLIEHLKLDGLLGEREVVAQFFNKHNR
jgi:hypothetical protein